VGSHEDCYNVSHFLKFEYLSIHQCRPPFSPTVETRLLKLSHGIIDSGQLGCNNQGHHCFITCVSVQRMWPTRPLFWFWWKPHSNHSLHIGDVSFRLKQMSLLSAETRSWRLGHRHSVLISSHFRNHTTQNQNKINAVSNVCFEIHNTWATYTTDLVLGLNFSAFSRLPIHLLTIFGVQTQTGDEPASLLLLLLEAKVFFSFPRDVRLKGCRPNRVGNNYSHTITSPPPQKKPYSVS